MTLDKVFRCHPSPCWIARGLLLSKTQQATGNNGAAHPHGALHECNMRADLVSHLHQPPLATDRLLASRWTRRPCSKSSTALARLSLARHMPPMRLPRGLTVGLVQ